MDGAPDTAPTPPHPDGREIPLREPESEALRARILAAVATCCSERGYAATTSDQIARRAGVTPAEFQGLFRDKEDAYLAMSNMLLGELLTAATSAYSPDKPLVQWVREAAGAILELLAARPTLAKIVFLDCRTSTDRALQLYQSGVRVLVSLLDQVRNDSLQEVPIPSRAARGAIGGAEALLRFEVGAGRAEQLQQIHPQIVYSCLVPLLGQEEALRQAEIAERELAAT